MLVATRKRRAEATRAGARATEEHSHSSHQPITELRDSSRFPRGKRKIGTHNTITNPDGTIPGTHTRDTNPPHDIFETCAEEVAHGG
jgi:hypothetical protein